MPPVVVEVRQAGRAPLLVVVDGTLELGRECSGLNLADPLVSRRHCALIAEADGLTAVDLGSTNGVRVNGVTAVGPIRLGPHDVLELGATTVRMSPDLRVASAAGDGALPEVGMRATLDGGALPVGRPDLSLTVTSMPIDPRSLESTGTTVTIWFSDIEGSTAWAEALGDQRWFDVLRAHDDVVQRCARAMGGTEVKHQGDGFMLTFPSARRAVLCAQDVQRGVARLAVQHPDAPIRVRIGLHVGEAINVQGDLFGKHVIVASRITGEAQGGQILASALVRELVETRGDVVFGPPVAVVLRGLEGTYDVHEIAY